MYEEALIPLRCDQYGKVQPKRQVDAGFKMDDRVGKILQALIAALMLPSVGEKWSWNTAAGS